MSIQVARMDHSWKSARAANSPGSAKVLLLDWEEGFAGALADALRNAGIRVDWYRSLAELGSVGRLGEYDALVVDPLIGPVNGLEIAEYAERFFPGLPVMLVGSQQLPMTLDRWPSSVLAFSRKDCHPSDIATDILKILPIRHDFCRLAAKPRFQRRHSA